MDMLHYGFKKHYIVGPFPPTSPSLTLCFFFIIILESNITVRLFSHCNHKVSMMISLMNTHNNPTFSITISTMTLHLLYHPRPNLSNSYFDASTMTSSASLCCTCFASSAVTNKKSRSHNQFRYWICISSPLKLTHVSKVIQISS